MGNVKFTLVDAATVQRHVRTAMQGGELNISQSFEICYGVFAGAPTPTSGHYIDSAGVRKPIPGAITGYVDGKAVIANPLPEKPEPTRRKMSPVSIDALCEVDGDVDEAETHTPDDPRELSVEELQAKINISVEVNEQEVGLVPEPTAEEESSEVTDDTDEDSDGDDQ